MLFPELAVAHDGTVDLTAVWGDLTSGREAVIHSFFTQAHCGLVLARQARSAVDFRSLPERPRLVLESVLRGTNQNAVAIELNLSSSTIAGDARVGLRYLGVGCKPSRVHPLLMLAASVARYSDAHVRAVARPVEDNSRVVLIDRPDLCLRDLPRAQRDTIGLLVEGHSYAEMAAHRGTSPRTIANQIAASFRTLGCSGRGELMQRLFVLSGWLPKPSANAA